MKKAKERFFIFTFIVSLIVMVSATIVHAEYVSKDGVTMNYNLTLNGSTWQAVTTCYEDMDSRVSLFLYKSQGGTLLYSNLVFGRDRIIIPGTSVTATCASISKTENKAYYGRSVHALVYHDTNSPYIGNKDITKGR